MPSRLTPPPRRHRALRLGLPLVLALVAVAPPASAQRLQPKRLIASVRAPGCQPVLAPRPVARQNEESRRLLTLGQEFALAGDPRSARDVLARAADIDPGDERIAYQLARAHEELNDTTQAVTAYCRYLALARQPNDSSDIRARIERLSPVAAISAWSRARTSFQLGLREYDARRYPAAVNAFAVVTSTAPTVPEGHFNSGVALSDAQRRADAALALERYLVLAPQAIDADTVRRWITALARPAWSPGGALGRGLVVPGLGQFYTQRPGWGFLVLALVAGTTAHALTSELITHTRQFTDPFGNPLTDTYVQREYPNLVFFGSLSVGTMFFSALEASQYAKRSQRASGRR